MTYKIKMLEKISLRNPIMIEGLPGIGNVGKVAADFIIDSLKAKKFMEIYSYNFPHAVFVNEKNMVELPIIELYYKKLKNQDIIILAGDVQPIDEVSCYEFCEKVLDIFQELKGSEIITIGGIGLQQIPKEPKVYYTANTRKIIDKYKSRNLINNIYGVVGPIIGVSGLLVGLAQLRNVPAMAMLAETFGHPSYLGIRGAREVLNVLNEKLDMKMDLGKLDEEITEIEKQIKTKTKEFSQLQGKKEKKNETNYIG